MRVKSNYEVEYYSHVMHIASQVEGEIREGLDAVDALIAGFPAGTVSGAPKFGQWNLLTNLNQIAVALTLVLLAIFQSLAI